MHRHVLVSIGVSALLLPWAVFGQEAPKKGPPPAAKKAAASKEASSGGGYRKLAPGVMITIPPDVQKEETFSRHDLVRLLARDPNYGERRDAKNNVMISNLAKEVRLSHAIWALEFNFKVVRMLQVDVPRPGAKFDRKLIWYLVYNVRNLGDKPVKFVPRILMYTDQKVKLPNGDEIPKIYADRLIPVAMDPIRRREDPRRTFLDTVDISKQEIKPSTASEDNSVWGVVTWEDIDPRVDYFSIYVQGLTNAYKIETVTEQGDEGKPQRKWTYLRKTLELNFWRPGDEFFENEKEIRYGQPNNVEHRWVYK